MTAQTATQAPVAVLPHDETHAEKYLTFCLGRDLKTAEFGIQVRHVREIMCVQEITEVPRMPPHLKGVINLRGKIIPVVDLRVQLAFPEADFTDRTCIVVVQVMQDGAQAIVGLIVDRVCEVLNIAEGDIEGPPDFGGDVRISFVLGIAKLKGSVKILLRIEELLDLKELRGCF